MKKRIIFRADGGTIPTIGMGHVTRCVILAQELQRKPGTEILFLMREGTAGLDYVRSKGFRAWPIPLTEQEDLSTMKCLVEFNPDIMVVDSLLVRPEFLAMVKKTGVILFALDYNKEERADIDCTINPILSDKGQLYGGYDYMVLPQAAAAPTPAVPGDGKERQVFVSFGGFDKNDITGKFVEALNDGDTGYRYHVVVGSVYEGFSRLGDSVRNSPHIRLYQNPVNFTELLQQSDMAVVSGGLTMFQAAAAGIPSLVVSQYDHQGDNARKLQDCGAVEYLGSFDEINSEQLIRRICALGGDEERRRRMSVAGRRAVDGQGNARVVNLLSVIDRLDWDSDFFNLNIAYLYPKRLRENIVQFALKKCEEDLIDCVYYLCDCNDPESVRLAEKYDFHFVDIRTTFGIEVSDRRPITAEAPPGTRVRVATPADRPALEAIAQEIYRHSRYFFDRHFPEDVCRRFYADWIAKSIRGEFDHAVLVAEVDGRVAGYVSCRHVSPTYGSIGLLGIDETFQGRNIGPLLIDEALKWFAARDLSFVHVVTQGRNLPAQRLYQKCGFRTEKLELWYHKWFRERHAH